MATIQVTRDILLPVLHALTSNINEQRSQAEQQLQIFENQPGLKRIYVHLLY
jgi:hypothetical protein